MAITIYNVVMAYVVMVHAYSMPGRMSIPYVYTHRMPRLSSVQTCVQQRDDTQGPHLIERAAVQECVVKVQ